jgi:hypothetical protein
MVARYGNLLLKPKLSKENELGLFVSDCTWDEVNEAYCFEVGEYFE